MKQETLEEVAEKRYPEDGSFTITDVDIAEFQQIAFTVGAKYQQEKLCNSEVIQRIRASKSDAEARRIIKTI